MHHTCVVVLRQSDTRFEF
ncbi:hypothetical protein D044_2155A, partial [Vibrio parahaemolyticus EKP-026]